MSDTGLRREQGMGVPSEWVLAPPLNDCVTLGNCCVAVFLSMKQG